MREFLQLIVQLSKEEGLTVLLSSHDLHQVQQVCNRVGLFVGDCTHTNEIACSVLEAVENGEIDEASYENYLKMEREKAHFESTIEERRKKDKEFGKILKNYKKGHKEK